MAPERDIYPGSPHSRAFLGAPLVQPQEIPTEAVIISGAPHDSTHTSRFGTRMGPNGIREGSLP